MLYQQASLCLDLSFPLFRQNKKCWHTKPYTTPTSFFPLIRGKTEKKSSITQDPPPSWPPPQYGYRHDQYYTHINPSSLADWPGTVWSLCAPSSPCRRPACVGLSGRGCWCEGCLGPSCPPGPPGSGACHQQKTASQAAGSLNGTYSTAGGKLERNMGQWISARSKAWRVCVFLGE